ncbi:hypothetical protein MPTK1_2g14860 [Marchantia polymorpha subsp. ruderalis]|uniref:Uncharacterized protein n=1 Tax=Marchantia polymorpha TaxID=3197 RepID=A0A2R6X1U1_MARPO|nr:hypothetical protein MARPO_0042s0108 [Marchantia polymorpha]BBN02380.1 hypothetical protein Mp_2g14860 [Marchantia polymorpha subsp. ruderalis]|eukprot:PTQ40075.1 hypothetical protein MARPO_0042s0108 [Marchantia polymorpha]
MARACHSRASLKPASQDEVSMRFSTLDKAESPHPPLPSHHPAACGWPDQPRTLCAPPRTKVPGPNLRHPHDTSIKDPLIYTLQQKVAKLIRAGEISSQINHSFQNHDRCTHFSPWMGGDSSFMNPFLSFIHSFIYGTVERTEFQQYWLWLMKPSTRRSHAPWTRHSRFPISFRELQMLLLPDDDGAVQHFVDANEIKGEAKRLDL